jgi:diacylglycerol kinase (ATP)
MFGYAKYEWNAIPTGVPGVVALSEMTYFQRFPEPGMPETSVHIALLCNPLAGSGRSIPLAKKVADLLRAGDIPCQSFIDPWPAEFEGFTDIWLVGGDGTTHRFINRYPDNTLPLGLIDGGTGNDIHWQLYGNLPIEALLARILTSEPQPVDIGICNGERFINGLGIGFEGAVAQDLAGRKKRPGKASYTAAILRRILGYRCSAYRITADGEALSDRWLMVDVNNGGRNGGGFHVAPQALPDDGWLDLMTVAAVNPIRRFRYLPVIQQGRHLQLPFVHCRRIRELTVESDSRLLFHMDGEAHTADRLQVSVLPAAIHIRY